MNTTFEVMVDDWTHSRQVQVTDTAVVFEVGLDHNHCPTCAARVRHVEQELARQGIAISWQGGGRSTLYVVLPPLPENLNPMRYLAGILNLPVR